MLVLIRLTAMSFREFNWIKSLPNESASHLACGIGDDAAVIQGLDSLAISTDSLVENSHFLAGDDPYLIGKKCVNVNLSDMAAMGCQPLFFLFNLHMTSQFEGEKLEALKKGLLDALGAYSVALIGGDTVKSSGNLLNLVGTVLGKPFLEKPIYRSGAKANEYICVTGPLGGSFPKRHLDFEPRVAFSREICNRVKPSSMMDISDGLFQDLNHIAVASQVGVRLLKSRIPIHEDLMNEPDALMRACADGEDFELLFTVPKDSLESLRQIPKCMIIGETTLNKKERLWSYDEDNWENFPIKGFEHGV